MSHFKTPSLILISISALALALAHAVHAQQPPDVVQSDSEVWQNTAMGSHALEKLDRSNLEAIWNTAAGFSALGQMIAGTGNTAFGAQALATVQEFGTSNTAVGSGALFSLQYDGHDTAVGAGALGSCIHCESNTAVGDSALLSQSVGNYNTATGALAMLAAGGNNNTAAGYLALSNNQGDLNTATGYQALGGHGYPAPGTPVNTGYENTATGANSLSANTSGHDNTASGFRTLFANTTGSDNTATGQSALQSNTAGYYNTADGQLALFQNTAGNENTADGSEALYANTSGSNNTAIGHQALYSNLNGIDNTAVGKGALQSNSSGRLNTGLGYQAGYNLTSGSNNIDIANAGVAADSGVIRIGTAGAQAATYVAGIYGTPVGGNAVVVSSTGQLGVVVSSERFKTTVAPMGERSGNLEHLRPVTFHLKSDPQGALQYGLIAEEVAKVYPDLVIRGQDGSIDGVRYDELAPMLLNELQKLQAQVADYGQEIRALRQAVAAPQAAPVAP